MNNPLKEILVSLWMFLFLSSSAVDCQDTLQSAEQAYDFFRTEYGLDQVLINGKYFEDIYKNDLGTPFFEMDKFIPGYMVVHGIWYNQDFLGFNYDIFNQRLVVIHTERSGQKLVYVPPLDFVTEFGFNDLVFRKYEFEGKPAEFYQEVFDSQIKCLYAWTKHRMESDHNGNFMAFKYYDSKRTSYLVFDNEAFQYKSTSDFLKLFPEECQGSIKKYIKNNKVNVKSSSDLEIRALLAFCENELNTCLSTSKYP